MDEDELRALVDDLLKTESDQGLVAKLMQYRFDAMLEGLKPKENAALAPALAVPDIDKEVLLAQGNARWYGAFDAGAARTRHRTGRTGRTTRKTPSVEVRRPTQDELMGYHDDDDDFPDDETAFI